MGIIASSLVSAVGVGGSALAAFVFWSRLRRRLAGTTLLAAWWWCLAPIMGLTLSETASFLGQLDANVMEAVRMIGASATFCPLMAVLGARRPQHKAWGFVVITLWGVLVLPAVEKLLLQPDQPLEIHDARSWFLLLLIGLGWVNYAATPYWSAATWLAGCQALLLWPYLPFTSLTTNDWLPLAGCICGAIAFGLAAAARDQLEDGSSEDRLWSEYRNRFGALWALRGLEQFNTAAEQNEWPLRLSWSGFVGIDETPSPAMPPAARRAFYNILRRFLSPEHIGRELGLQLD